MGFFLLSDQTVLSSVPVEGFHMLKTVQREINECIFLSSGIPAWKHVWNTTEFKMWQEYALLSNESQENPLLMVSNSSQTHHVPVLSDSQLEEQTIEAFRMLKVCNILEK